MYRFTVLEMQRFRIVRLKAEPFRKGKGREDGEEGDAEADHEA